MWIICDSHKGKPNRDSKSFYFQHRNKVLSREFFWKEIEAILRDIGGKAQFTIMLTS